MNTLGRIEQRATRRATTKTTTRKATGPAPWQSAGARAARALALTCLLLFLAITAPSVQAARSGQGEAETSLTKIQLDAGQSLALTLLIDTIATEGDPLESSVLGADVDVLSRFVTVSDEPSTKIAEPQTALLMGVGLGGLAVSGRKKRSGDAPRKRQLKLTHTLASAV